MNDDNFVTNNVDMSIVDRIPSSLSKMDLKRSNVNANEFNLYQKRSG